MNTPYQWTKQVASHFGGTRNGTIVHWPRGIKGKGEIRSQFSHVIDIAPTVLEAAGIPAPTVVNGIQQAPYEGASMLYAFKDAKAAEARDPVLRDVLQPRHLPQGMDGGHAARRPLAGAYKRAFDDDVWELYDTNKDWTQSKDLAKENPKKLAELQRLFLMRPRVQRAAARQSHLRALQCGPGRAAAAHQRQVASPVRRHVPPERRLDGRHAQQVLFGDRGDRSTGSPAPTASSSHLAAASVAGASTHRTAS